jgi:hypothetical protein
VSKNFNDTLKHKVILVLSPTSKGYDISFQYGETIEREYRVPDLAAPLLLPLAQFNLL